jgi:hypothetical protein
MTKGDAGGATAGPALAVAPTGTRNSKQTPSRSSTPLPNAARTLSHREGEVNASVEGNQRAVIAA